MDKEKDGDKVRGNKRERVCVREREGEKDTFSLKIFK